VPRHDWDAHPLAVRVDELGKLRPDILRQPCRGVGEPLGKYLVLSSTPGRRLLPARLSLVCPPARCCHAPQRVVAELSDKRPLAIQIDALAIDPAAPLTE
jgi:hypothetical protein